MSNKGFNWEKAMDQFTSEVEQLNNNKRPAKNKNVLMIMLDAIISLGVISGIGGLLLMLCNMIINTAWPSLDAFDPGIGFRHAAWLFACFIVLYIIVVSVTVAMVNRGRGSE